MEQITFSLSDTVAAQAREAGLLTPECLEKLLKDELRRQAIDRFSEVSNRIQAAIAAGELDPISEEEIVEEVRAVRKERRARTAAR